MHEEIPTLIIIDMQQGMAMPAVGSPFWPGRPGVEFQHALAPLPSEHVVEKNVPDALINTELER